MAAASNGHSEVVALLAERGANIQAQFNVRENAWSYTYVGTFYNFNMRCIVQKSMYMYECIYEWCV